MVRKDHPYRDIYESHEQIVYAARMAGDRGSGLLPEEPRIQEIVSLWVDRASLVGNPMEGLDRRAGHCIPPLTFPLFATMVAYIPYRNIFQGLLTHPNKERPLFFTLLKLLGVRRLPWLAPLRKVVRQARDHMAVHLDGLARQLESLGGPWIAGADFTLADVSWVVLLDRLVEADWDGFFWGEGRRPTVAAYWDRLRQRPSYASAIAAARCVNTVRGIADLRQAKGRYPGLREGLEGP